MSGVISYVNHCDLVTFSYISAVIKSSSGHSELCVLQIRKVNAEINQLFEKRMMADSSDDKLSMFRQQVCFLTLWMN